MATIAVMPELYTVGKKLVQDDSSLGLMRESHALPESGEHLRGRMEADGYLLLRGALERDLVLEARRAVLEQLEREGQLVPGEPVMNGVPRPGTKLFFQPELAQKNNEPLQRLLYAPEGNLMRFFASFLGGEVRHYDFTWLRCVSPGLGTPCHCDIVFMGRGTRKVYTAWVPLGDITFDLGGLIVLEGSHQREELQAGYGSRDVDSYCENDADDAARTANGYNGWLSEDANAVRAQHGGRWLGAEYQAGDVVVFCMDLVHGGLDNRTNRLRLSSDSRYQLASEAIDDRWIGEKPAGHSSAGKRGRIC